MARTTNPDQVYDPLLNAQYTGGGFVDRLTGMPLNVTPDPLASPPATPSAAPDPLANPQPQQVNIDVGAWEKDNQIYKRSQVEQKRLFDQYVDKTYSQWQQANPNSTLSKDDLRQRLQTNLSKNDTNYITRDPESGFFRDLAGTAATAVTGLVDAGAGLINAGVSSVTGKNAITGGLANVTHKLDEAAHSINSEARQDFDRRFNEIMGSEDDDKLTQVAALYATHPGQAAWDVAGILGTGLGAGATAKVGLRAGANALAGVAEKTAATSAAKLAAPLANSERLAQVANVVGQGGLAAGQGAQSIGAANGDFQLTRQQALGAGVDGLIAGLATGLGMRYGYTPESILLGATPVKLAKTELPSILKTTLKSMGVEAGSNAVQGLADAILTTGYDKDGNFDMSKVDWNKVEDATAAGGAVGALFGTAGGVAGGVRDRRAAKRLQTEQDAAAANETGPTATSPEQPAMTAEQRAMDDSLHTDPVTPEEPAAAAVPGDVNAAAPRSDYFETRQTVLAPQGDPLRMDPQDAFMNNPIYQRDMTAAQMGPPEDPLRARPQTAPVEPASPYNGTSTTVPRDFQNAARTMYDRTSPDKREAAMASIREFVQAQEADPETQAALQREVARTEPDYVEQNPELAQIDQQRLRTLDGLTSGLRELERHHQLSTTPVRAYSSTTPAGPGTQQMIDSRVNKYIDEWKGKRGSINGDMVAQARGLMEDYRKTPDRSKASFVERINQDINSWFERPFDEQDGRPFDVLDYDARHGDDPAQKSKALALANKARPEAIRRVRLQEMLNEEHREWLKDDQARRAKLQQAVTQVSDRQLQDIAATTVMQAQDGAAINAVKRAGREALQTVRKSTRAASEKAKVGIDPKMRVRLDRDMLSEQRGSEQFAQTAAELTGAPRETLINVVRSVRDLDPLLYGKENVARVLADFESSPGASGRPRRQTTQYLNYLQDKQDTITHAIGEWRPISMEDVRRINAGIIPELNEVGTFQDPADGIKNTRRYVQRIVNDQLNSGTLEGDGPARIRLLQDWLLADMSEASYLTPDDARLANADIPTIRELRTMNDGDFLASGKPGTGDPLYEPNPAIRAALAEGDLSAALGRAIIGLPTNRAVLLRALKTMVDRLPDPVRVRISEDPLNLNGREVPALYDSATGEIVIDTRYADIPYVMAHEAVHAATQSHITEGLNGELGGHRKSAYDALTEMWREAQRRPEMPEYGRQSLPEFIAEALSNPEMQDFLKSYQSNNKRLPRLRSLYRSFVDAVRRMIGLPPKSFAALEDIVGLTNILQTGGEATNTRARVVETKGLQSGLLSRYVERDGTTAKEEFGYMQRLVDGSFHVVTDSDSAFGKTEANFDTWADADKYVRDTFGAEIRELTDRDVAIREGLLSRYDAYNPVISRLARSIETALGRYLPDRAQPFVSNLVQSIATGAQWLVMQTDRFEVLNTIDRALESIGIDSNLYGNFEKMVQLQRAQGRIGSDLAIMLTVIGDKLRPINRTADDLGRYMQAMHGIERNARNEARGDTTAFKHTDAAGNELGGTAAMEAYLRELSEKDRQVLHAAAEVVWKQWQTVLKEEERSGILSTEQYRRMGGLDENGQRQEGAYQYYVPMRNEADLNGWLMPKQGVTGRSTEAANPFAALMIQLQQRMGAVHRNDALRDFGRVMRDNPIPEVGIVESFKLRWDVDGKLVALPESVMNRKNAVYWREGGVLKVQHINTETLQGQYLLKALRNESQSQNALIRGLGSLTRVMAMFNTRFSPAFQLKTIAWDITTTLLNYQGAFGGNLTAADGAKLGLRTVLRAPRVLGMIASSRYRNQSSSPAFNLFGKLGGGMGMGAFLNESNINHAISFDSLSSNRSMLDANGLLKGGAMIAKGHGESVLNALHSADDAIRFSSFVEYLQHHTGKDITLMNDAELTAFTRQHQELVDRGIKGSKEINGNFERQGNGGMLHNVYAFWNAAMQGSRLFASIAGSRQGQYGMMALLTMGVASALQAINDPDDDDGAGGSKYAEARNRTNALIFGDYAVPLAYEARSPFVVGNSIALALSGKISGGQMMKDILTSILDMGVPLMPLDSGDLGFSTLYAATPTAAQLAFPLFLGKTAFNTDTEASFVTGVDGKRVYNPTPVETAKPGTSWLARQIAEGFDTVGLGGVAYPGRIDAAIGGILGSSYTTLNSMLNPATPTIMEGRNPILAPIVKDFYSQPNDYAITQKYKDLQQERSAEYRRKAQGDNGRDMLANGGARVINQADRIDKLVRERKNAIRIEGKTQAEWLQQMGSAKESGDKAAAQAAQVALQQLRQRQSMVEGWGIQELKKLDASK